MPVYEYECKNCGNKSDEVRQIDKRDEDRPICIYCGNGTVRVLSGMNVLPIVPYGRFYGKRESYPTKVAR